MRPPGTALVVALLLAACGSGGGDERASRRHSSPSPAPHSAPALPVGTGSGSWLTYHHDARRTGVDTSSPAFGSLRHAWSSPQLDGAIYAEPLIRGSRVFVATEHDTVYALNTSTGRIIWRRHVGKPVPQSQLPCGNIDPTGITGTPVIRARTDTLYAVAFVQPGKHQLVAIDTGTGRLKWRRNADPSGTDPLVHQQRGALVIAHDRVYAPFGGLFGDCGEYHGMVIGRNVDGSGTLLRYKVPSRRQAGIWAASGIAVDSGGGLLVATGNGDSTSSFDYGNAVIRLSGQLKRTDFWAPSNWKSLNSGDTDLGSIGPSPLPNGLVFQGGKEGIGYLLRQSHLGHIGGSAFAKTVCGSMWGGTAYLGGRVFVPCDSGLYALRIKSGPSFGLAWHAGGFFAGPPIVAGGVVWSVDISGGRLYGFDPATGKQRASRTIPAVEHFSTPAAANGKLYVAATRRVVAFAGV